MNKSNKVINDGMIKSISKVWLDDNEGIKSDFIINSSEKAV